MNDSPDKAGSILQIIKAECIVVGCYYFLICINYKNRENDKSVTVYGHCSRQSGRSPNRTVLPEDDDEVYADFLCPCGVIDIGAQPSGGEVYGINFE